MTFTIAMCGKNQLRAPVGVSEALKYDEREIEQSSFAKDN
jgi:hypothetical protein